MGKIEDYGDDKFLDLNAEGLHEMLRRYPGAHLIVATSSTLDEPIWQYAAITDPRTTRESLITHFQLQHPQSLGRTMSVRIFEVGGDLSFEQQLERDERIVTNPNLGKDEEVEQGVKVVPGMSA